MSEQRSCSPDDICHDCGLARRDHHHDGAAYGRCGQFSEISHSRSSPGTEETLRLAGLWFEQQIENAERDQKCGFAAGTAAGTLRGERAHARNCAMYEAQQMFLEATRTVGVAQPQPASLADALRKNCGATNGCSCADLNYQWYGEHCAATMTSVFRTMLKDAAVPPSPAEPFNEILKHVRAPNRPDSQRLDRIEAICLAALAISSTNREPINIGAYIDDNTEDL